MEEWEDRKRWFRIGLIFIGLNFLFWMAILILAGISDNIIPTYTIFLIILITVFIVFRKKIFQKIKDKEGRDKGKHKRKSRSI